MKSDFTVLLLKLKMLIDNVIEDFSNSFKILFLVSELGLRSPKELCKVLNMAKSNLAILASKLKSEQFLEQEKTDFNNKEIYYSVTPLGKSKLDQKIESIKIDSKQKEELICKLKLVLGK